MIDSLAQVLAANKLEPDAFTPYREDERIFRGEVEAYQVFQAWRNLARAAKETNYWPIIRGGDTEIHSVPERDPDSTLACVPEGSLREVLQAQIEERRQELAAIFPEVSRAADVDELAQMADATGVYAFLGHPPTATEWPERNEVLKDAKLRTLERHGRNPSVLLLIRVNRAYESAAYLDCSGWNGFPSPELQVAVLREWHKAYGAVPACITHDVVECIVPNPSANRT